MLSLRLKNLGQRLLLWACLSSASIAAEPVTLAASAQSFAESTLKLASGSVSVIALDPGQLLGECAAGWQWAFAFNSRTTVEVACTAPLISKRFVALRIPNAPSATTATELRQRNGHLVALHDLPYGHIITADDLILNQALHNTRLPPQVLTSGDDLIGKSLTRAIRANEPLVRNDVRGVVLVKRNTSVAVWSQLEGARVTATLIALESGQLGDWIKLENPQSRRKVRGEIQLDGSIRVGRAEISSQNVWANAKVPAIQVD